MLKKYPYAIYFVLGTHTQRDREYGKKNHHPLTAMFRHTIDNVLFISYIFVSYLHGNKNTEMIHRLLLVTRINVVFVVSFLLLDKQI